MGGRSSKLMEHVHTPILSFPLTGIVESTALEYDKHPILFGAGRERAQGILAFFPRVQGQFVSEVLRGRGVQIKICENHDDHVRGSHLTLCPQTCSARLLNFRRPSLEPSL